MNTYPEKISGLESDPIDYLQMKNNILLLQKIIGFKTKSTSLPLIILLLGGTGVGKSTIFNTLCKTDISKNGVERPSTNGGIIYAHPSFSNLITSPDFPWLGEISNIKAQDIKAPLSGYPDKLILVTDKNATLNHLIIDSPDIDSVIRTNAEYAKLLSMLADIILFITTPEKYADENPFSILEQCIKNQKKIVLILNKVTHNFYQPDLIRQLQDWKLPFDMPFFSIPLHGQNIGQTSNATSQTDKIGSNIAPIREYLNKIQVQQQLIRSLEIGSCKNNLKLYKKNMEEMLGKEWQKYQNYKSILTTALKDSQLDLAKELDKYSDNQMKSHLKPHIRNVYEKYDFFAPARKILSTIFIFPLKILGLQNKSDHNKADIPFPKIESTPLFLSLTTYQLYINNKITDGPFAELLRQKKPGLSRDESKTLLDDAIIKEHQWLKEKFDELQKGLPGHKKIGIHTLSIIWGATIIVAETFIGGGISIMEMAIDSLLAPYVTAGTLEIFIVNELKNIIKELRTRYKKAVFSIIDLQHQQYLDILNELKPEIKSDSFKPGLIVLSE